MQGEVAVEQAEGPPLRVWECIACGWRYDERLGDPDGGIPPGTLWQDIPDDWACPECGAAKAMFDMRAVA